MTITSSGVIVSEVADGLTSRETVTLGRNDALHALSIQVRYQSTDFTSSAPASVRIHPLTFFYCILAVELSRDRRIVNIRSSTLVNTNFKHGGRDEFSNHHAAKLQQHLRRGYRRYCRRLCSRASHHRRSGVLLRASPKSTTTTDAGFISVSRNLWLRTSIPPNTSTSVF